MGERQDPDEDLIQDELDASIYRDALRAALLGEPIQGVLPPQGTARDMGKVDLDNLEEDLRAPWSSGIRDSRTPISAPPSSSEFSSYDDQQYGWHSRRTIFGRFMVPQMALALVLIAIGWVSILNTPPPPEPEPGVYYFAPISLGWLDLLGLAGVAWLFLIVCVVVWRLVKKFGLSLSKRFSEGQPIKYEAFNESESFRASLANVWPTERSGET